jgi:ankyrin repeat protein
VAVARGHLDIVKALLARPEVDVNSKDKVGRTPLMIAVEKKYDTAEALELLKSPAIKVNEVDITGRTALIYGVIFCPVLADYLLNRPETSVTTTTYDKKTGGVSNALIELVKRVQNNEREELLNKIVRKPGVDINIRMDDQGNTPLIYAAWSGSDRYVKVLMRAGAKHELHNKEGKTAKFIANERKLFSVVNAINNELEKRERWQRRWNTLSIRTHVAMFMHSLGLPREITQTATRNIFVETEGAVLDARDKQLFNDNNVEIVRKAYARVRN